MIKLSKNLSLPDRLPTMKLGILGRTGSGKTNTATVMAEQMIAAGIPIAIIDPQGDWWGLRTKYQIAILGGENADVPLESTGGSIAADFVINERIPVLLDLFSMGEGEMVRFATDFAKRLWTKNRDALHVFLDEADLFAPQRSPGADKAKCLGAWQNVCRRGRSRGLGLTMISQRPAVINKDLLTQADPIIFHRLTAPQDLAAVDLYLEFHGYDKAFRRSITKTVSKLAVGEAMVFSPGELEIEPTEIKVSARKSFDSSATPEAGQSRQEPKSMADVNLEALKASMADTIEKAQQSDPKFLTKRIRELENELKLAGKQSNAADIDSAVNRAVTERDKHWRATVQKLEKAHSSVVGKVRKAQQVLTLNGDASIEIETPPVAKVSRTQKRKVNPVVKRPSVDSGGPDDLSKAERNILIAFFWTKDDQNTTPAVIGFYSGYSHSSGGFNNACSKLRTRGFVDRWNITDGGESVAETYADSKPNGPELREWLRSKLSKSENAILDVLIDQGEVVEIEKVADLAGYSPGSGGFNNALSRLRSIEAAHGYARDGGIRAADVFFEL